MKKVMFFKSETDTEVVAHLAEELDDGNFLSTVRKVLAKIEGSYSLVFMDDSDPDTIICTKKDNPLIIGLGKGETSYFRYSGCHQPYTPDLHHE